MNIVFTEKRLTCADCGQEFTFTEGEQRYFWSKGYQFPINSHLYLANTSRYYLRNQAQNLKILYGLINDY